jgi:hypothetical protein
VNKSDRQLAFVIFGEVFKIDFYQWKIDKNECLFYVSLDPTEAA